MTKKFIMLCVVVSLLFGIGYTYWSSLFITHTYYSDYFPYETCNTEVNLENNSLQSPEACIPYVVEESNGFPFQFIKTTYEIEQNEGEPLTFYPTEMTYTHLIIANVLLASTAFFITLIAINKVHALYTKQQAA